MICYYQNSKGEILDLMKYPYRLITGNLFDYEWEETSYSNKIYGFQRRTFEKDLKLDVFCKKSEFNGCMDAMEMLISRDVIAGTPGKLHVNGEYLECYVKAVQKEEWEAGIYTIVTFTIISDRPFWISEESKSFYRRDDAGQEKTGLDYPFNYPFDYAMGDAGTEVWYLDAVGACPFTMVIYGPVTNPRLLINDNVYEIYTTLGDSEYLILDTNKHTIIKYLSNGTTSNLYNNRRMEQSVFDPLEPGRLTITWSGTFGFDLTAYIERSEPSWST